MAWLFSIRVESIMPRMTIPRSRISCRRGVPHFKIKDQQLKILSQANWFKTLITPVKWAVKPNPNNTLAKHSLDRVVVSSPMTRGLSPILSRKRWLRGMRVPGVGDKSSLHNSLDKILLPSEAKNIISRIHSMQILVFNSLVKLEKLEIRLRS